MALKWFLDDPYDHYRFPSNQLIKEKFWQSHQFEKRFQFFNEFRSSRFIPILFDKCQFHSWISIRSKFIFQSHEKSTKSTLGTTI